MVMVTAKSNLTDSTLENFFNEIRREDFEDKIYGCENGVRAQPIEHWEGYHNLTSSDQEIVLKVSAGNKQCAILKLSDEIILVKHYPPAVVTTSGIKHGYRIQRINRDKLIANLKDALSCLVPKRDLLFRLGRSISTGILVFVMGWAGVKLGLNGLGLNVEKVGESVAVVAKAKLDKDLGEEYANKISNSVYEKTQRAVKGIALEPNTVKNIINMLNTELTGVINQVLVEPTNLDPKTVKVKTCQKSLSKPLFKYDNTNKLVLICLPHQ